MTGSAQADIRNLARFRYAIRKFLRSSDEAARKAGLTPQQHQVLLGIAGFTSKGSATIGELAEFLQLRHHSVVGLVDRAEAMGLVRRAVNDSVRKLRTLTELHRKELYTMRRGVNLPHLESAPTRREVGKGRAAGRRTTRGS
jgi:DNA-binding MarR family transcriptional regulator